MAYTGTTFITFPDGTIVDVANTRMAVSGNMIQINRADGSLVHTATFPSAAAALSFVQTIGTVVSTFIYSPIVFVDWSADAMNWNPGEIPANTSPIFLQAYGQNLGAATSAEFIDSSGRVFNLAAVEVTPNVASFGPFASPGQNSPAQGTAILRLFNSAGTPVASTTVTVGPNSVFSWTPATEPSLYEWLKADAISQSQGSNVTTWPHSAGIDATCATPTFQTNVQNGLPVVRFAAGNSDTASIAGFSIGSQPFTLAIAFRNTGSNPTDYLLQSGNFFELGDNTGNVFINLGLATTNLGPTDNNFHILVIVFNGASTTYAFDGAPLQTVSTNPGTTAPVGMTIASQNGGGGNYASVDVGELAFWTADGTNFYGDLVEYLMARWG